MNKKTKILLIVAIIVIVLLLLGKFILNINNKNIENKIIKQQSNENILEENVQKLSDGTKLNISDNIRKTKMLGDLKITNIQLKAKDDMTILLADVENNTDKKIERKNVRVEVLDKSNKIIMELKGVIDSIEPKGKDQLYIGVTADISNAYDINIIEVE